MLSGIGPADHLQEHDIRVVSNSKMVGQGMSDNPMNALFIPSPTPVEPSLVQTVGISRLGSYIEAASSNFAYAWMRNFVKNTYGNQVEYDDTLLRVLLNGGTIFEKIIGPISTGQLELESTDPEENPLLTFNYFKEPEDLKRCVNGMQTILNVIDSEAFSRFRFPLTTTQDLINLFLTLPVNLRLKGLSAAFSLEQFCIDTVMTIWHYHGGCQVGRVVDNDYRVLGVQSLRVVDGSTFLDSPGTNPQATVMMLGR